MKKFFEFTYRTGKRLLTIKNEIAYNIILSITIIILFLLLFYFLFGLSLSVVFLS